MRASVHDSICGSVNTLPMLAGRPVSRICALTTNTIRNAEKEPFSEKYYNERREFQEINLIL